MAELTPTGKYETRTTPRQQVPWWAKLIALVALLNLILGLLNLSYVPLRDIYLKYSPSLVQLYDPIKGIEPHPQTENYLRTADELVVQLPVEGLEAPTTEKLLASLRSQSISLIEEDPFMVASKFATFAKVQRRMREHIGTDSAKEAFLTFWSSDYLSQRDVNTEIDFFYSKIAPLIATNYFRNTDYTGQFVDDFWRVDVVFIIFFGIDILVRSLVMSRQNPHLNWFDAILRRWYDVFLLLPVWRWLRIVPVTIRLHKAKLMNLERILAQITYEPAAYLSDRVAEFVTLRLINHAQESVEKGDMARALLYPQPGITVNDINEVEAITDRLMELTIYKVLPKIQPEMEALLHHSLESAIKDSSFYDTLRSIPAFGKFPDGAIEQLANWIAKATYDVLASSYSDIKGRVLFDSLTKQFQDSLKEELKDEETLRELQSLLSDLLEEMKLNYIQKSKEEDPEERMEELERLQQVAEESESSYTS
jgi:hypothetical protein